MDRRVSAIDTLKGVSMVMIWYAHFIIPWYTSDWEVLFRVQWYLLDFFGPVAFVLLSTLGTLLSTRQRFARGDRRVFTRQALAKASFLLVIGEILNLPWYLDGFRLVNWNVVTTIAIFSLLLPAIMRLPRGMRLALAAIIAFTYYPLLDWSMATVTATGMQPVSMGIGDLVDTPTVVYFALFFHPATTPVYSWLLIPLLGSVLFEPLAGRDGISSPWGMRRIGTWGGILVATGVLTGLQPVHGIAWHVYDLPVFWVRHTPQYLLYCTGIVCILLAAIGTLQARGWRLPGQDHLDTFGRHPLTAFVASHVAMLAGWFTSGMLRFPFAIFLVLFVATIITALALFRLWDVKAGGFCTVEWAMGVYVMRLTRPRVAGVNRQATARELPGGTRR